jgi:hypothetical protein
MRKTILLLTFALTASLAGNAQTTKKHKPSAAVRSTPAGDSTAAPASITNGPVYEDEKQPAPAATPRTSTRASVSVTPAELPTGTAIRMKLETSLSSRQSNEGDSFSGRVTQPVVVSGKTVIPVGASITGRLLRVSDPRRIRGSGSMHLMPESVMLPNGKSFAINASMVDTSIPSTLTVDDEGRIKSKGINSGDKIEMVAGTGTGAIIGTIAGGGKGLLVGSMIGGGAAVVHWLTKRHPVDVPAGTELIMEISRPMTVSSTPLTAGE